MVAVTRNANTYEQLMEILRNNIQQTGHFGIAQYNYNQFIIGINSAHSITNSAL